MSQLPAPGLGARIAYYRKLNGWSAERLAQEAGDGVTRAILAQLEAGRRESLSVQQFCAVSIALGLPPAALLSDAFRPMEEVERPPSLGGDGTQTMPSGQLLIWAAGYGEERSELPSAKRWHRLLALLTDHFSSIDQMLDAIGRALPEEQRTSDDWTRMIFNIGRIHQQAEDGLRDEGVDLGESD